MVSQDDDVWCMEWLIDLYQTEVVSPLLNKASFLEDFEGVALKDVEDVLWKEYEEWAEERILKAKETLAENMEE